MGRYGGGVASTIQPGTTGERLRLLREERGWTRRDVEAALIALKKPPLSPSTLEKWESGKAEPTANKVATLAELYNVTLDYLFLLSDDPDQPRKGTP